MKNYPVGMKRRVVGTLAATTMIGGLVVLGAPVTASALDTSCPAPGTTSGPVVVKAGETCRLDNNTVHGNVTVQPGGTFGATHTLITGSVLANGAIGENYLCASIVDGNVVVRNLPPSPDSFPPPRLDNGPAPANDFLINAVLAFPPVETRDCQFPVNHQIIRGSVQFINNASFVALSGSDVGGSVTARNNHADFYLVAGDISDDNINGNIICSGNTVPGFDFPGLKPFLVGAFFRGHAVGQCASVESRPSPIVIPGHPGPQGS